MFLRPPKPTVWTMTWSAPAPVHGHHHLGAQGAATAAEPRPESAARDYSQPILAGPGRNDYERYMRTDELLSLQRRPEDMAHRDELLFQTVHQSTELWLKHACFELDEAGVRLASANVEAAILLLARACLDVELITGQLEMLRHLQPWAFQTIRPVLGHGSGFESPGWRGLRQSSARISTAFDQLLLTRNVSLVELYQGDTAAALYRLAEALVDWDERVALWRARHYKMATRVIGHDVIGTKGTPVDVLGRLIAHKFFPRLWQARTELTQAGPAGDECPC
jgi:tryptophan 2,3-dioxygenase